MAVHGNILALAFVSLKPKEGNTCTLIFKGAIQTENEQRILDDLNKINVIY